MEGGKRHDEVEQTETGRANEEQVGMLNTDDRDEGRTRPGPTIPGSGGGVAETGSPGPGPGARPSGGAKDPTVSHDIPPSAHNP